MNNGSSIYRSPGMGPSAVTLFSTTGCSTELLTPYVSATVDSAGWSRGPTNRGIKEASNYVIFHHATCENVDDIRYALTFGIPVVIAVKVENAFQQHHGSDLYHWQGSGNLGNHALCVIGYDNQKQAFRVQNSWGQGWGDHGRFWVGYDEFQKLSGSERGKGWCYEAHAISADISRGTQSRRTTTPPAQYFFMPDGSVIDKNSNQVISATGTFKATEATDFFLYGLQPDGTVMGLADHWYDISDPQFPAGLSGGRGRMIASAKNFLYTITENGNVLGRVPRDQSTTGVSFWELVNLPENRKPIDIRYRSGSIFVEAVDGNVYRRIQGSGWNLEN